MSVPSKSLPDHPRPASYQVTTTSNVLSSAPIVGAHRTQTRLIGEAYHLVALSYDPIHRDDFAPLATFLNSLRGQHDRFNILLPNFAKSSDVLSVGNYVALSNGRASQISYNGGATSTDLCSYSMEPDPNTVVSNQLSVTAGVPVGVYIEISGLDAYGEANVSLRATGTADGGTLLSNEIQTLSNGRNFVMLTPTATQSVHVNVKGSTTMKVSPDFQVREGLAVGSTPELHTAYTDTASGSGVYFLPGPVAPLACSLANSGIGITYDRDSFIKLNLNLMERQI